MIYDKNDIFDSCLMWEKLWHCINVVYVSVLQKKMSSSPIVSAAQLRPLPAHSLAGQMLRVLPVMSTSPTSSTQRKSGMQKMMWWEQWSRLNASSQPLALKNWFRAIVKSSSGRRWKKKGEREAERASVYWELLGFLSLRHLCQVSHCLKRFIGRAYAC